MTSKQIHTNTIKKALLVKAILDEHYEPGNQAKMIAGVWRTKIVKVYPISYRTLMRYLRIAEKAQKTGNYENNNQLQLF